MKALLCRELAGIDALHVEDVAAPVPRAHEVLIDVKAAGVNFPDVLLVQGKYHQVKRMLAAVGNHVTGLHRSAFGALELPADLAPGQWRWVDDAGQV